MVHAVDLDGFVHHGIKTQIKYKDDSEEWEKENPHYALHYINEKYYPKIIINEFIESERSLPTGHGNEFLVFVVDNEIEQVVNLLKLLREGNTNVEV